MALEFDVDVAGAENSDEPIDLAAGFIEAALLQGCRQRALRSAGQADQALGVLFELFCTDRAFAFLCAQLHFGDQAAKILVAGAGGDEKWKAKITKYTRLGCTQGKLRHGGLLELLIVDF